MKPLTGNESYLSSGDYLGVIRDFALGKGIPLEKLLEKTQININELINPPELVDNTLVSQVGINLYGSFNTPIDAAMELGLKMNAASHGSLGLAVRYAENLKEALGLLKTYYHTRINSQDLLISEQEDVLCLKILDKADRPIEPYEIQRFFNLATLTSIANNTYQFLDCSRLKGVMSIYIDAPRPDHKMEVSVPGVELFFDSPELALKIPADWQQERLKIANPAVVSAAEQKCRDELQRVGPKGLSEKVRIRLRSDIENVPSIDGIAHEFYMSSATFKRHLKEEGATYQALKNEVRFELAKSLLAQQHSLEELAQKLGFSDASNFAKAFKQWSGESPKSYVLKTLKASTDFS